MTPTIPTPTTLVVALDAVWSELDAIPDELYPDRLLHHSETRALLRADLESQATGVWPCDCGREFGSVLGLGMHWDSVHRPMLLALPGEVPFEAVAR